MCIGSRAHTRPGVGGESGGGGGGCWFFLLLLLCIERVAGKDVLVKVCVTLPERDLVTGNSIV